MNKSGIIKLKHLARASSVIISCIACNSHAAIIINEIDYDQSGVDNAEFIELFNSGNSTISLDGYRVDLINGTKKRIIPSFTEALVYQASTLMPTIIWSSVAMLLG